MMGRWHTQSENEMGLKTGAQSFMSYNGLVAKRSFQVNKQTDSP